MRQLMGKLTTALDRLVLAYSVEKLDFC